MGLNWIEINKNEIVNNIKKIKKAYGSEQNIGAMIKANAYGHGLIETVSCILNYVEVFYVSDSKDAIFLYEYFKENNISKRIVCVGSIDSKEYEKLVDKGIELAIVDLNFRKWRSCVNGTKAKVHIFVDTGLGREGIRWDSQIVIDEILNRGFEIKGLMTHFNNAEHEGPPEYSVKQFERFNHVRDYLNLNNYKVESHTAASVPSLLYPNARCDVTRLGIVMYGYWTSIESKIVTKHIYKDDFPDVKPVLTWKAISNNIKIIPKGDYIGYDCAYLCEEDKRVAVINVGYYDGYPCFFNSNAWVLVNGKRCNILGNVMMNSMVIDLSGVDLLETDTVTIVLLGKSGEQEITVDDLAFWAGITNYDVLAMLKPHIERVIV